MLKKVIYFTVGILFTIAAVIAANYLPIVGASVPGVNTLVSVNNSGNGQGGNERSPYMNDRGAQVSANGKYVAFISNASNLVNNDTNGYRDVFVRDLRNSTTERVNISTSGAQANDYISLSSNENVAISSNGRYIAYASLATNLIDGQTSPRGQIYVRDRVNNTTSMVTQLADGTPGGSVYSQVTNISSDGRFVTYTGGGDATLVPSITNLSGSYVYVADLSSKTFQTLSPNPTAFQKNSSQASASCDGSLVAFSTNLQLLPEDTDTTTDVYLADLRNGYRLQGITSTSSSDTRSARSPSISCNGDFISFTSDDPSFTSLSTMSKFHVYLYDRVENSISIVDTSAAGVIGNDKANDQPAVDNNGNVVFNSSATNLLTSAVTPGQVYIKMKDTGAIENVSRASSGLSYGTEIVSFSVLSLTADGSGVVYFASGVNGTNLINSDTNGYRDVFYSSTGI